MRSTSRPVTAGWGRLSSAWRLVYRLETWLAACMVLRSHPPKAFSTWDDGDLTQLNTAFDLLDLVPQFLWGFIPLLFVTGHFGLEEPVLREHQSLASCALLSVHHACFFMHASCASA